MPLPAVLLCALLCVSPGALAQEAGATVSADAPGQPATNVPGSPEATTAGDSGAKPETPTPAAPATSQAPATKSRSQGLRSRTRRTTSEKNCESAEKKLAKERKYLEKVENDIVSNERSLQSCKNKSACAKYDADLDAAKRLKARHESRVEKFGEARNAACATKS